MKHEEINKKVVISKSLCFGGVGFLQFGKCRLIIVNTIRNENVNSIILNFKPKFV